MKKEDAEANRARYLILRRDFYDGACSFCSRHLKAGIALVVGDSQVQRAAGPDCGPNNASDPGEPYPDFTRGAIAEDVDADEARARAGRGQPGRSPTGTVADRQRAVEYLVLRHDLLGDCRWTPFRDLPPIFEAYAQRTLTDAHVDRLLRLIAWADAKAPQLTLRNLHACHAYRHWLERGVRQRRARGRPTDFVESLLESIRRYGYLTASQISKANECFEDLPGMPRLKADTFSDVERAEKERRARRPVAC